MKYLSVKEAAVKFGITGRRVQQLCETGRISGAQFADGIWQIPENAVRPSDGRSGIDLSDGQLSLAALCAELRISTATGRNWVRSGRLVPQRRVNGKVFFTGEYTEKVKAALSAGKDPSLKSRRNKKYISGSGIYSSYVSRGSSAQRYVQSVTEHIGAENITVGDTELRTLIAECAVRLLLHDTGPAESRLESYLTEASGLYGYDFLIDDLLPDKSAALDFIGRYPALFKLGYEYEESEDILGLLYLSLRSLGRRKAEGAYFTPDEIVKKLCGKLFERNPYAGKTIFDPCCGTGNFLLHLPENTLFEHIYGNDLDELSVKITRINLAVRFDVKDKETLYSHITQRDYLNPVFTEKYDFIIGNPPWGYAYSEEEKAMLRGRYASASGVGIESYDIFIEQALSDLAPGGMLSFVLPEAVLNAKAHLPIRQLLTRTCSIQYVNYLGNVFSGVRCPCVILQLEHTGKPMRCVGAETEDGQRHFTVKAERAISAERFSLLADDEEYAALKKLEEPGGKCFLAGNAVFALGIVTGNNRKYISAEERAGSEPVLKGSDLCRYSFRAPENFIAFTPEAFQQTAPEEYYRAPEKLLYRFICSRPVFAYDDRQMLSLNSCNVLIPQITGLSMKYILAILNSRIAEFYFARTFHSVKLLRSHIEQLPIPYTAQEVQKELMPDIETLLLSDDRDRSLKAYDALDRKIAGLYGLSEKEYSVIARACSGGDPLLPG